MDLCQLTENIPILPKRIDDARRFCGLKGQRVIVVKKECGLSIVRNVDSELTYWVEDNQIKEAEFKGFGYCYYCGEKLSNKEADWIQENLTCCNGFECGCMGLPTEPPICFACMGKDNQ